jgi:peptidoglycan/LPS O-acetylase OafA/YrhL
LTDQRRVPALDGLRGIAILIVFLGHFTQFGLSKAQRANPIFYFLSDKAGIGVDLFFVLSGFLITGILYDSKNRQGYFRVFYTRRTLRIFPLYYSVLILVAVSRIVFPNLYALSSITPVAQIANFTYTTNFLMAFRGLTAEPLFLGHFWSLAVEEQFYILWPLIVLRLSREQLVKLALTGVVAALLLRVLLIHSLAFESAYLLLPARMDSLLAGALIALSMRGLRGIPDWITSRPVIAIVFALFAADLIVRGTGSNGWVLAFRSAFHFSIAAAGSGILVIASLGLPNKPNWTKVLGNGFLRFFGKYSYAIYVVHVAIILALSQVIDAVQRHYFGGPAPFPAILLGGIAIALTVGVSLVSWHVIEQPFLKLKDRIASNVLPPRVIGEANG